jgi:mono/diheme cytochrome c family protein
MKMKRFLLHTAFVLSVLIVAMLTGAALFIYWGVYNVSALQQHTRPIYWLLDKAMRRSIQQRAEEIRVPPLSDPTLIERGFYHFREKCVQCHGAPGIAREDIGKGLTPIPANLVETAREWTAEEIYWTVKHGVKMTGMPAWEFTYEEEDLWAIVAFVKQWLPRLSPEEYRAMDRALRDKPIRQAVKRDREEAKRTVGGDPERGRLAIDNYACTACHTIPGIVSTEVNVGPPLKGMGSRKYIAGVLPNTPENLVRWIRDPQAVDPPTAMPDLNVTERAAHDIAAYLSTLE